MITRVYRQVNPALHVEFKTDFLQSNIKMLSLDAVQKRLNRYRTRPKMTTNRRENI